MKEIEKTIIEWIAKQLHVPITHVGEAAAVMFARCNDDKERLNALQRIAYLHGLTAYYLTDAEPKDWCEALAEPINL